MSYELRKPINEKQRDDFIVLYNHRMGLRTEDTEMFLFALEPNEIMGEKEIEIDVPDYETVIDEEGNERLTPVMIPYEETIIVPDYDPETGEQTGEHEETVTKYKQSTHKETIVVPYPVIDPDYEEKQKQKDAERIAKLHLTRGDVFRGLLLAKGVTRAQLRGMIEALPEETNEQSITKEMALIDFDEALNFYRGVALIDTIGAQLNITPLQMTKFFETGDYKELLEEEENESV